MDPQLEPSCEISPFILFYCCLKNKNKSQKDMWVMPSTSQEAKSPFFTISLWKRLWLLAAHTSSSEADAGGQSNVLT